MKCRMCKINLFLHFSRNNPRTTNYCYHMFIGLIGYDEWNYCSPEIVNAWNTARGSFDKMFGLIKAWCVTGLPPTDERLKSLYLKKAEIDFDNRDKALAGPVTDPEEAARAKELKKLDYEIELQKKKNELKKLLSETGHQEAEKENKEKAEPKKLDVDVTFYEKK